MTCTVSISEISSLSILFFFFSSPPLILFLLLLLYNVPPLVSFPLSSEKQVRKIGILFLFSAHTRGREWNRRECRRFAGVSKLDGTCQLRKWQAQVTVAILDFTSNSHNINDRVYMAAFAKPGLISSCSLSLFLSFPPLLLCLLPFDAICAFVHRNEYLWDSRLPSSLRLLSLIASEQ